MEAHFEGGQGPEGAVAPYMEWNGTLFLKLCDLQEEAASTSAGSWFQSFRGLLTMNISQYLFCVSCP